MSDWSTPSMEAFCDQMRDSVFVVHGDLGGAAFTVRLPVAGAG